MQISTVIVTADRDPTTVIRAFDSVLSQTVETGIVIVDAGTSENNVLKDLVSEKHPDVTYIRSPGSSAPVARNLGASYCDCDAICFLDDDDEWYPDKLRDQIQFLTDDVCLVTSPFILESSDNCQKESFPTPADDMTIMGLNLVGPTSFVMLSKDIFDKVGGFDTSFQSNQEWDLWMRMLEYGSSAVSKDVVGIKHHSDSSISIDPMKRRKGWYSVIRKHMFRYLRHPEQMLIASGIFMDEMQSYNYRIDSLFGKVGFYLACLLRKIRK